MAKVILGKRPKSIKLTVIAPMLDGDQGEIGVEYTYRTRREFAALIDETFNAAGGQEPTSIAQVTERGIQANAEYLQKILIGWDLDAEFGREQLEQLCDEQPGIALEIMSRYRQAITEGRLGN